MTEKNHRGMTPDEKAEHLRRTLMGEGGTKVARLTTTQLDGLADELCFAAMGGMTLTALKQIEEGRIPSDADGMSVILTAIDFFLNRTVNNLIRSYNCESVKTPEAAERVSVEVARVICGMIEALFPLLLPSSSNPTMISVQITRKPKGGETDADQTGADMGGESGF